MFEFFILFLVFGWAFCLIGVQKPELIHPVVDVLRECRDYIEREVLPRVRDMAGR